MACLCNVMVDPMPFFTSLEVWIICISICSMHMAHDEFDVSGYLDLWTYIIAPLSILLSIGISYKYISGQLWLKGRFGVVMALFSILSIGMYTLQKCWEDDEKADSIEKNLADSIVHETSNSSTNAEESDTPEKSVLDSERRKCKVRRVHLNSKTSKR